MEAQDNGPNKTEIEPRVSVDNVVGAHVLKVHSLLAKELQRFVYVFEAVDTHFAFCWTRLELKQVVKV